MNIWTIIFQLFSSKLNFLKKKEHWLNQASVKKGVSKESRHEALTLTDIIIINLLMLWAVKQAYFFCVHHASAPITQPENAVNHEIGISYNKTQSVFVALIGKASDYNV